MIGNGKGNIAEIVGEMQRKKKCWKREKTFSRLCECIFLFSIRFFILFYFSVAYSEQCKRANERNE